ncbi:magnesium transporter [Teredinibacter purpureus]|uniref:magnesium transporter n=1 Tax=Teredinibacter purpureus TaxID=2731756 RepID=UPI0005F7CDA2|nr:magnesium transporter [Teredinibacter purpureus]
MPQAAEQIDNPSHLHLSKVQALLDSGTFRQVRRMLNGLRPPEIAHLIESSPPQSRTLLWDLIDKDVSGEVLEELSDDVQSLFLQEMDTEELVELTEGLDTDDIVDILQQLPEQVIQEVLEAMTDQDRSRVEAVIAYDEATAGGLTNTDTITVRPRFTLDVVLRYLRRHTELPPSTDSLIVVNRKDDYLGILPLAKLLTTDPNVTVREVMVTDTNAIPATLPDRDVAKLFELHDWVSAPVVDENGKLLGRITIDDVVDVIREDADHSLMSLAGLDEDEDTFATVRRSAPRRAIWLGVNLLTAILASTVISLFDATIEKVVALAILMPIVASMGGVAGSQTLTVVIRGMALGHIGSSNLGWLLSREVRVGLINGLLWATVMAALAAWWFNDMTIALILGSAMIINLITAALAGALLPAALKSMNIDPALAGGVTLTTVTDVVGFFSFLGLATYFYG